MNRIAVVGSGQTGLSAAIQLARRGVTTSLTERLPCAGGQEPEHPLTDRLTEEAEGLGVELRLATLAVSWNGRELTELGTDGWSRRPADGIVVATGSRPATRAELGIEGDRCAGVLPGSAAVHLSESGVLLGHRPVIVGSGQLARHLAPLLFAGGAASVLVVTEKSSVTGFAEGVSVVPRSTVIAANGMPRINSVLLRGPGGTTRLAADALLLAGGRVPMRNIEGAVYVGPTTEAPGVAEAFSAADPKTWEDAKQTATRAVGRLLDSVDSSTQRDRENERLNR